MNTYSVSVRYSHYGYLQNGAIDKAALIDTIWMTMIRAEGSLAAKIAGLQQFNEKQLNPIRIKRVEVKREMEAMK